MKLILDTNVLMSGIFFSGPPYEILKAWRSKRIQLVISPSILSEYKRVGEILEKRFSKIVLEPILELLTIEGYLINDPKVLKSICEDPTDEKFIVCAIASQTKIIISGDKHLLRLSGYKGLEIIKPRLFIEKYLNLNNK